LIAADIFAAAENSRVRRRGSQARAPENLTKRVADVRHARCPRTAAAGHTSTPANGVIAMTRLHIAAPRTIVIAILALLFLLAPRSSAFAGGASLRVDAAVVTLSGTSNVHPYQASTTSVKVTRLKVSPAIAGDVDALAGDGVVEAFDIAIAAATLTSPKGDLDKNLHKALKTDQHADITFCLSRLEKGTAPNAFKGIGKLTIAGVEREVALDLTVQKAGTTLAVKGTLALVMTDYGITPPKAMLGMLKTDPKVTITFETTFNVEA
jgi:polyisoprenoid-binding protein YceI